MSSDGYFDDELDSAFLNEVDAIEAAHIPSAKPTIVTAATGPTRKQPPILHDVIEIEDSDDYYISDVDEADIQVFDELCNRELTRKQGKCAGPSIAGPSKAPMSRTGSMGTKQMTLFGDLVPQHSPLNKPASSASKQSMNRTVSNPRNPFGEPAKKCKQWDHSAFAKTGWRNPNPKEKGKSSFAHEEEEEEEFDEPIEFEQFPAPVVCIGLPPPMKFTPDLLAAKRWIFPLNQPKRDYQFNIIKQCLFKNTLVALPTGLGKTFVAGVVMLNFYTWFPEGKVVFVAPTRPLVSQQIDACHESCGIPGSHAAELTGQTAKAKRAKEWQEKRVIYGTPQTLMNDLRSDNCDPRDITLLVIDEAHRGTGDYAYAQVVRYLMAKNAHFRVLALSATPGATPEAVQNIVDALHISHVEVRNESSLDVRPYIHKKHTQIHIIKMSEDILRVQAMLVEIMDPLIKQIQNVNIIHGHVDARTLHAFRCTKAQGELACRRDNVKWAYKPLARLGCLARAMAYLVEASTAMCHRHLLDIASGTDDSGKKASTKSTQNKLQDDPKFQAVIRELESQKNRGFALHPKMEKLKVLLIEHFAQGMPDTEDANANGSNDTPEDGSRVIIFMSYRECVSEVTELLNQENPLIRATQFIGQSTDKKGKKGFGQREQLDVIRRFKAGEFNVLVSTSIGEEGLDIGEVDMIVCYDSSTSPVRTLQRVGRTGRKKDGHVHVLLAEHREEKNWEKTMAKYEAVQRFMLRTDLLELYDDVDRMLPDHIKPECVEMMMDIEKYVREDPKSKKDSLIKSPLSKSNKRKRNDDIMRNIPAGATTGFLSVKELLQKGGAKKRRKPEREFDPLACESDEDDLEIEAGINGPRRTISMTAESTGPKKKKPRRATTIAGPSDEKRSRTKTTRKRKTTKVEEPTSSQFHRMGAEDSDDAAIERGLFDNPRAVGPPKAKTKKAHLKTTPPPSPSRERGHWSSSPEVPLRNNDLIDLTTPDTRATSPMSLLRTPTSSPDPPLVLSPSSPDRPLDLSGSSPDRPLSVSHSVARSNNSGSDSHRLSQPPEPEQSPSASSRSISAEKQMGPGDSSMAWLIEDDDELDIQLVGSSPSSHKASLWQAAVDNDDELDAQIAGYSPSHRRASSSKVMLDDDDEVEFVEDYLSPPSPTRMVRPSNSFSPVLEKSQSPGLQQCDMPPPPLPSRFTMPTSPFSDETAPEPTFAVRAPGRQSKKRTLAEQIDSSPLAISSSPQRRLQHQRDSPEAEPPTPRRPKQKKQKFRDASEAQRHNPWIDMEATHSGDDRSLGSSGDEMVGNDSDIRFTEELPETQVSPSYDQSAVYRQSLLTQVPGGGRVPTFADHPARRGAVTYAYAGPSRPRAAVSSSPPRTEDGSDDYVFGSFVVDDDAEIPYMDNSSEL